MRRLVPPAIAQLIEAERSELDGRVGPLQLQFEPDPRESSSTAEESLDPLLEAYHAPLPRLIHRYRNRVLVLVTDRCAVHCRHCFRRAFTGSGSGEIDDHELDSIAEYLGQRPEIAEVVLSGGDALMLASARLLAVIDRLRRARKELVLRLATRVPIADPGRLDARLAAELACRAPVWLVCQINHHRELSSSARAALARVVDSGIPVVSQTVLLAGVNDSVEGLAALFESLVALRVKPYYLFQPDLVAGTSHLRVPLPHAIGLVSELRRRLSGLAMPTFAVDAPGGGGKVMLEPSSVISIGNDAVALRGVDGKIYHYPVEEGGGA